MAGLPV